MAVILIVFLLAMGSDLLSCEWQSARERGQLVRLGSLSGLLEALSWVPVVVFVYTESWPLIAASIVGAIVGGVWGGVREKRRAKIERCNCCLVHDFPDCRGMWTPRTPKHERPCTRPECNTDVEPLI